MAAGAAGAAREAELAAAAGDIDADEAAELKADINEANLPGYKETRGRGGKLGFAGGPGGPGGHLRGGPATAGMGLSFALRR